MPKRTLTYLPHVFWFEVLRFLSLFVLFNLFISSKGLKGLNLKSSSNYKYVFESMNYVCDERVWNRVLSFSIFSNRVKRNLKNDLEIFLYLKFRFHLFVFFNHSLYSVFLHFCLCKKTCDQKKSSECYCQFCSRNYPYIFDDVNAFQNIIIDKQDFALKFNKFFQKSSLFSLGVCHNHALFIDPRKAKIYK